MHHTFTTLQGVQSRTFTSPPLDGSLLIADLFDYHAEHSASHLLFVYDDRTITWEVGGRAIREAARLVLSYVNSEAGTTVAIIADTDAFSYLTLVSGIMRAGCLPFPISLKNSPIALAHLLQTCKCTHVFTSQDSSTQASFDQASKLFNDDYQITTINLPSFDELFTNAGTHEPLPETRRPSIMDPAIILHSSGSTSLPKPVYMTQKHVLNCGMLPYYGERDLCGSVWSTHALPMYHAMGVHFIMLSTCAGITMSHFSPHARVKVPSSDTILKGALRSSSTYMFCVPSVIEEWALSPEDRRSMAKFEAIVYAGAPLDRKTGSELMADGIKLSIVYGCSEAPAPSMVLPNDSGLHYEYFKMSDQSRPHMVPQPDLPGVFELVFVAWANHHPSVVNFQVDGQPAFATNDLIEQHPTLPRMWRVYGRADDQIMHSTGQKTNPLPIENIFLRDNRIVAAVIFGRGKPQAGILLDLHLDHRFDSNDTHALRDFRQSLQFTIDEANAFAPQQSRIFPEMIIVSHPDKPITLTAKGRPQRGVVLTAYAAEIEAVYGAVDEASQPTIPSPDTWSLDHTTTFVHTIVLSAMRIDKNRELLNGDDLFIHGCDSIGATWIRNTVQRAIRDTVKVSPPILPQNVVYQHPTVEQLSSFISALVSGVAPSRSVSEDRVQVMNDFVDRYSTGFSSNRPAGACLEPETRCVMLTGSTGNLGSHVLAWLAMSPEIHRVYALNRRGTDSIKERHRTTFKRYGIDTALLGSPKLTFLDADFSLEDLSLPEGSLKEIARSVTNVFHLAWSVDFNRTLASFEPHLKGLRNLIDLTLRSELASPPSIVFTSSVSVLANCPGGPVPEVYQKDPSVAIGMGYAESKWIAEQILHRASISAPHIRTTVVRIGQLSGGSNGYWEPSEWFPSLVKAGKSIGYLPKVPGSVSWLPIDKAAALVAQTATLPRQSLPPVVHLRHQYPISASEVMAHISDKRGLKDIPYNQWIAKLRELDERPSLLEFFERISGSRDGEAFSTPVLALDKAAETFRGLGDVPALTGVDIEAWLAHWDLRKV